MFRVFLVVILSICISRGIAMISIEKWVKIARYKEFTAFATATPPSTLAGNIPYRARL